MPGCSIDHGVMHTTSNENVNMNVSLCSSKRPLVWIAHIYFVPWQFEMNDPIMTVSHCSTFVPSLLVHIFKRSASCSRARSHIVAIGARLVPKVCSTPDIKSRLLSRPFNFRGAAIKLMSINQVSRLRPA